MTERVKIETINGTPKEGMFVTRKDCNTFIAALSSLLVLAALISKAKKIFH